jgi:hypothetical protein
MPPYESKNKKIPRLEEWVPDPWGANCQARSFVPRTADKMSRSRRHACAPAADCDGLVSLSRSAWRLSQPSSLGLKELFGTCASSALANRGGKRGAGLDEE